MLKTLLMITLGIMVLPSAAEAQPKHPATGTYVGAKKCKNCHQAKASGGAWHMWKRKAHSDAFENLASVKARKFGREKGIDDPQAAPACLACHVTGYGLPAARFAKRFDPQMGVQCESCHGPGAKHVKARLAAVDDAEEEGTPAPVGPVTIGKGEIAVPTKAQCTQCHNKKSPSFKSFDCKDRAVSISHRDPRKPGTEAQMIDRVCK